MKKTNKQPIIHPRGQWVLVQPKPQTNTNDYGLTIPDSVEKEKKAQGQVVSFGPDVEGLEKGDIVLYGMYAGEEIQLSSKEEEKDKVDFILLLQEDILATIEL